MPTATRSRNVWYEIVSGFQPPNFWGLRRSNGPNSNLSGRQLSSLPLQVSHRCGTMPYTQNMMKNT